MDASTSAPSGPIETRAPAIILGNVIAFVIPSIFVLARFWSKLAILRVFHTDDWLVLVSWLFSLGNTIICIESVRWGAGRHQTDIPYSWLEPFFLTQFVNRIVYQMSISLTKLAICVMYYRIFGVQKMERYFLLFLMVLLVASTIAFIVTVIFACNPIAAFWDFSIHGKCLNGAGVFWASAIFGIVIDVVLLVFSVFKLSKLQLRMAAKVILMINVNIGWIIIVASIIRVVRIAGVLSDDADSSWRTYDTSIWSSVEVNVALLCVSVPACKPLLKFIAPHFLSTIRGTKGGGKESQRDARSRTHGMQSLNTKQSQTGISKGVQVLIEAEHV